MESDWEDIRRLAADLKRVQLTDTAQRLSERCVVELVGRLLKERRLMLIHSRDGKDILTLDQLEREIIDEVHAHGGRANLPDLQQLLNVDVCHIEAKAVDMCRSDKELTLILGQILHSSYLDRIGEDVNDRLQEAGFVNVSELCKVYDLPTDFLTEVLRERLGSLVSGRGDALDLGVVYTDAFVSRHRARIRGLFTAITRPTSVHNLINQFGFQERLFYTVLEELVKAGRLKGSLVGGRREHSVFVPQLYARTQNQWVDNFLSLNGFLELEALSRLGIPDPDGWVRRRYEGAGLVRLATAYVRPSLIDAVHAALDEALATGTWVDVQPLLPSSLSPADVEGESVRAHASQEALRAPALVISEQQLLSLSSCAASTAPAEQGDERRRRVHDTKASRGNAREGRKRSALLVATQGEPGGAGSQRRQGRRDLQEELSASVANIRLFLRGALLFPDDVQPNLSRHLLKTLCADVGNSVFASLASDATSASSPEAAGPITAEGRLKILGKVPEDLRRPLVKLHAMMGGKSVEEFLSSLEEAAEACDLMIKKVDRKRERQLLFQHRQALLGQLGTCEDPALVLHLTATLLFQQARQAALHAPGRSVPSIVAHLHGVIPPDHHALLLRFQSLVVKLLIGQGKGAESAAAASSSAARSNQDAALGHAPEGDQSEKATAEELRSLIPSLKELVTKPRKTSGSEA
ncbi:unnamed protein product [Lampetra fluviatilis]